MDSITHNQLLNRLDALLAQLELDLDQARTGTIDETARLKGLEKRISVETCQSRIEQARATVAELIRQIADASVGQTESGERSTDIDAIDLEQRLRAEIHRLRAEGQEKHSLLHSRNEEVLHAKAELDQLSVRFSELETMAMQAATEAVAESELIRTELQAQLALLQAELSQKEWALQEKQAIVSALEQRFNARIAELQLQSLDRKPGHADGGSLPGRPAACDAADASSPTTRQPIMDFESERHSSRNPRSKWRTGGISKRRWKRSTPPTGSR